jgi:hypothetical protein
VPQDGISTALMVYMLLFQAAYFGLQVGLGWISAFSSRAEWYLWTLSNAADFGLVAVYVAAIPAGTYLAPWLGRWLFGMEGATHILQVAEALPSAAVGQGRDPRGVRLAVRRGEDRRAGRVAHQLPRASAGCVRRCRLDQLSTSLVKVRLRIQLLPHVVGRRASYNETAMSL